MNYENPIRRGKLYFRYGTMGSAKTAMLLTTAYNFEERGMDYICMKPIVDNREKDSVIRSRIGIERRCSWIYPESDMYKMLTEVFDTEGLKEWILIDEAQFLSPSRWTSLPASSTISVSTCCATVCAPTSRAICLTARGGCLKSPTPSTR